MKFQFPPYQDENAKDTKAETDELRGAEALSQPDCRDEGAEDGDAGIHEGGEPGT